MNVPEQYQPLLRRLQALPPVRRAALVVRSQPFGEIIEADTRVVHGVIEQPNTTEPNAWQNMAYGIVRAVK